MKNQARIFIAMFLSALLSFGACQPEVSQPQEGDVLKGNDEAIGNDAYTAMHGGALYAFGDSLYMAYDGELYKMEAKESQTSKAATIEGVMPVEILGADESLLYCLADDGASVLAFSIDSLEFSTKTTPALPLGDPSRIIASQAAYSLKRESGKAPAVIAAPFPAFEGGEHALIEAPLIVDDIARYSSFERKLLGIEDGFLYFMESATSQQTGSCEVGIVEISLESAEAKAIYASHYNLAEADSLPGSGLSEDSLVFSSGRVYFYDSLGLDAYLLKALALESGEILTACGSIRVSAYCIAGGYGYILGTELGTGAYGLWEAPLSGDGKPAPIPLPEAIGARLQKVGSSVRLQYAEGMLYAFVLSEGKGVCRIALDKTNGCEIWQEGAWAAAE